MYCNKCKNEIDNNSTICVFCGAEIIKESKIDDTPIIISSLTKKQLFLGLLRAKGRNSRGLHLIIFLINSIFLLLPKVVGFVKTNL
ncbi:MAG: hypothetical protein ABH873_09270 [Candidatus Firestonebacteria bacterium]